MKKSKMLPLQSISPLIDYKDFYSNYHKRKKPFLLIKEKELPQIKTNSNINYNSIDDNKTNNNYNIPILSPQKINTNNSTYFPKINTVKTRIKNAKLDIRNKIQKKEGQLSIKYLDIIKMNKINKLLIYEIGKDTQFEEEATKNIYDPITKRKILNEIDIIEKRKTEEIEKIMNNTTKREKEEILQYFTSPIKIINLYAVDIFKEFNKNLNKEMNYYNNEKTMKNNASKNKIKKIEENKIMTNDKNYNKDFLECVKNNIIRKIEFRNQYNKEISLEYIEMILRNEIEKLKLIVSVYLNENKDGEILFNPEEQSGVTGNSKKKNKNLRNLDKSIQKLFKLNNFYSNFIKTNYNKDNYPKNNITRNEITQYNYNDILQKDNNRYNSRNEYINNMINQTKTEEQKENKNSSEEKEFHEQKNNLFLSFDKFSGNKGNKMIKKNTKTSLQDEKKDLNESDTNNEIIERRTIHTNKKEPENEDETENNNKELKESKSYKIVIENEQINSTNNKDIISLFERTKYNNNNTEKENKKFSPINKEQEPQNIDKKQNEYLNKETSSNFVDNEKNEDHNSENDNNIDDNNSETNEEMNDSDNINSYENEEDEEKTNEALITNSFINDKIKSETNLKNDSNIALPKIDSLNNINNPNKLVINKKENTNKKKKEEKSKKRKKKLNQSEKAKLSKEKSKAKILENPKSKKNINNNNTKIRRNSLTDKDPITKKTPKNNNINTKKANFFRKSKMNITQNRKALSPKKRRRSIFSSEKAKKFLIKDFEILDKNKKELKRNLSEQNLPTLNENNNDENNPNQSEVNIIKLHEDDIDQIVDFINEEERRRIRRQKNAEKMSKENKKNEKSNLYSLFKVKKKENEEIKTEELTREDLVEKLTKDDWRIRQYIEDIIRAGLTMGNKHLNKQMKNKSILMFQGLNLGVFKFKKNFGIKEEVNIEPFRPLSHNKRTKEEKAKNSKDIKTEEKEKKKNKEKQREKKLKEAKDKLVYDNSYLFSKKRPSVNFILRNEVEEILHGGILLQKKAKDDEEKNIEINNRFLPPKRQKFVKKKKNRAKLFRKSKFLNEVNIALPIKEFSSSSSNSVIKEESDKSFEEKVQTFIERIKKLKKGEELNTNEIDELIMKNRNIRDKKQKEKENRMQGFLHMLNEYRDMNNDLRKKNNNFSYKVPILIRANSDIDLNNSLIN